jgi:hypothetical protein
MKKRSRASGEASKARGRKALKTKRRDASQTASSSAPTQDAEIARLSRELNEAREQQTATSEVLQVISGSPSDLEPVVAAILESAVRVCDASFGDIGLWEDGAIRLVAIRKMTPPAFAEERKQTQRIPPTPNSTIARIVASSLPPKLPSAASSRAMVGSETPERPAKSPCDQPSKARAALS